MNWPKSDEKVFFSTRRASPTFLAMKHPGLIMEMGFFYPRLSRTAIFNQRPLSP